MVWVEIPRSLRREAEPHSAKCYPSMVFACRPSTQRSQTPASGEVIEPNNVYREGELSELGSTISSRMASPRCR
jgi:hypothetical protein